MHSCHNLRPLFVAEIRTCLILFFLVAAIDTLRAQEVRRDVSLDNNWYTIAHDSDTTAYKGFEHPQFDARAWTKVDVPHNWDTYEGYRRLKHGNRHGYAWYRKVFTTGKLTPGKRYFLFFEGVGSYATVWLNGKKVAYHAGGRTTFTIDVTTTLLHDDKPNTLAVRADHPPSISDLPWVCGGCSEEVGFSEGSQPMGIFRPVHLVVTDAVRIEPFGVHVWNDTTVTEKSAVLNIETEVKNYGDAARPVTLVSRLVDRQNKTVAEVKNEVVIAPQATVTLQQQTPRITDARLWSPSDPYLYTLVSQVLEKDKVVDATSTTYGIRWIRWPSGQSATGQFFLNGKPLFINGTCEYEHRMGQSHAFTEEQVGTRARQIKAAGFNAFRDAHQPHNLRYHQHWDELGLLWWPQMAAHIWFDTPEFRHNFKTLLKDWVKERRNSPSVILWGLQNESKLPAGFAAECTALVRALDPTASSQRKVTTCNGGEGTDWDVPQNWTGTYGGNPLTYAQDIQKQVLIGEYGAWRSLDLHTEGPFVQNAPPSEDRFTQLMETKVQLAESAKHNSAGHFHWLFTSHENPGRVQGGEGLRELDRVGPINYKGLLTPWDEPLDAFYMYRSNYAPKEKEPMVYIASHTWPDRWTTAGKKDSIAVYSNCDEVELFNDMGTISLGKRSRAGVGTHFQWNEAAINYNVLYAVGYVAGKAVARDVVVLHHLPQAPGFARLAGEDLKLTAPQKSLNYLYRVNCGGTEYTDTHGNLWMADVQRTAATTWGSTSWTDEYKDMPAFYASQRQTHDPISGTQDWPLFQAFRYGREKLRYDFPVPDGDYVVDLYFSEPWYGTGGGLDCTGWRLFDVAVNDQVVIKDLDLWKEGGHDKAIKKIVKVKVRGGKLSISFPRVTSGQALISAMAIASANKKMAAAPPSPLLVSNLYSNDSRWSVQTWLTTGHRQYAGDDLTFSALPPALYGATWIRTTPAKEIEARFTLTGPADVFIAADEKITVLPAWMNGYEDTRTFCSNPAARFKVWRKRFAAGATVKLGENGTIAGAAASMYTVMALPVTALEPAVDLRPTTGYNIDRATITGTLAPDTVLGRRCVTFHTQDKGSLEWKITPGVANLYALRFRYYHTSPAPLTARMQLIAADGTIMKEETLEFIPVNEKKWKLATTSTGTMINAGNYRIVLTPLDAEGLSIRDLEVQ